VIRVGSAKRWEPASVIDDSAEARGTQIPAAVIEAVGGRLWRSRK